MVRKLVSHCGAFCAGVGFALFNFGLMLPQTEHSTAGTMILIGIFILAFGIILIIAANDLK
jgi:hypothetical protein